VLRGLPSGILVMNVQSFSMPIAAYNNPRPTGPTAQSLGVGHLPHLRLPNDAIFSMLFGAASC
jgi:uncharacterized membrane protein YeiB